MKITDLLKKNGIALNPKVDSKEEAIRTRLKIYDEQTSPLVEYYNNKGVLRTEEVSEAINRLGADVANDVMKDIK